MKRWSVLVWAGIMTLLCFSLADAGDKKLRIALVPKDLENPVFVAARESAEARADHLGVELIWTAPPKANAAAQAKVIDRLIREKVDAIGISVTEPAALRNAINRAAAAGIAVATWDSDAPGSRRLFYLGTDNHAGGVRCGTLMKGLLGEKGGRVAVLTGIRGAFNLEERIRGFREATQGTKIQIVDILSGGDDIDRSVAVVNRYTQGNPGRFDAWFFAGGWPLFVPIDRLRPLQDFHGKVVSFDSFAPMLPFVKAGIVDVLVGQDFAAMGRGAMEMLYRVLKEGAKIPPINDSGLEIVDAGNIDDAIRRKGTTWNR
ncbi:MAG: substrate-binding domain-containing protein [Deltaproteobacteria bacterium]|nr:substrate-binding domain-containing protein [Deltaproteobacteria bacterium]